MSKTIVRDQRIFIDAYELTSRTNTVTIEAKKDAKESTGLGQSDREYLAGLKDFTFGCAGQMDIDDADEHLFNELDGDSFVLTVTPETQAVGGIAFLMDVVDSDFNIGGQIGEVAPYSIGAAGKSAMTRGVLLAIPSAAISGSGVTAGVQVPGALTGMKLKMSIHVLSASGTLPTLEVVLQSDSSSGFGSAVDLYTSEEYSDIGAEFVEGTLESDNTWFRLSLTVGGTDPSFNVLCAISII